MEETSHERSWVLRLAHAASGLAWAFAFALVALGGSEIFAWAALGLGLDNRWINTVLPFFLAAAISNFILPRPPGTAALGGIALSLDRRGARYLLMGLALGALAAALVVGSQLSAGWAFARSNPDMSGDWSFGGAPPILGGLAAFAMVAGGEELFWRGYGFQQFSRAATPWGSVLLTAALFGLLHGANPNSSPLALVNTALFGLLFGFALVRHRSLWLPFGLHLGWNFALGLVGARVSGLTIRLTELEIIARGPTEWSGGDYGPEGSLLAAGAVLILGAILAMTPVAKDETRLIWESSD